MIFTDKLSGINFNVPIIYFIHIPKTAGSALKSPKIINLGHKLLILKMLIELLLIKKDIMIMILINGLFIIIQ